MMRSLLALIDERPLTRVSVSKLLRTGSGGRFTILAFSEPAELLRNDHGDCTDVKLIVLNVGARDPSERPYLERIKELKQSLPDVPIVVLSDRDDVQCMAAAFRHGVRGYIPTTLEPPVVVAALRLVQAGGTFIPTAGLLKALEELSSAMEKQLNDIHPATFEIFTSRELEVVQLLQQGKANKLIAHELEMCESTVKVHVRHIMKKLKVSNRTHAAIRAYQMCETQERPSSRTVITIPFGKRRTD